MENKFKHIKEEIRVIKTITNESIIGRVSSEDGVTVKVKTPLLILFDGTSLGIASYDAVFNSAKLSEVEFNYNNILHFGQKLDTSNPMATRWLKESTGIDLPESKSIVGGGQGGIYTGGPK